MRRISVVFVSLLGALFVALQAFYLTDPAVHAGQAQKKGSLGMGKHEQWRLPLPRYPLVRGYETREVPR